MQLKYYKIKGKTAAQLRQRKFELVRQYNIPENALPGSLVKTHRKCGRSTCDCASSGKGHSIWFLTFMVDGKKRVETIPKHLVDELLPLVEQGREYKKAVAEVFAINAQLLTLWKKQNIRKRKEDKKRESPKDET